MYKTKRVIFFLLPGSALLLLFYVIPLIGGIQYSLQDGTVRHAFVGLENYRSLWANPMFQLGMRNTLELSLIGAPTLWLLSLMLASGLSDIYPRGGFARASILIPYLAPTSALILVWLVFFDYGGWINLLLNALGMERVEWLSSGAIRIPVLIMFLWKNLGLCVVIFLSAIRSVPDSLYESAELDGIRWFRKMFSITLPMIRPSSYLIFILSWINAFRIFSDIYFIAGPYPDETVYTLQHYMNNTYEKMNYQMVTSAAYSFALIVLVLFGILFFLQQRSADAVSGEA